MQNFSFQNMWDIKIIKQRFKQSKEKENSKCKE